jgi:glycosyltransferase 2 family protein
MYRRLFYALSILLGLAGLCTIPFVVGIDDLLRTIGQVGWLYIVIFVANSSCTLLIPALGWWLLMRAEGIPVSLWTTVQANLMGFPVDFLAPSAYLGGEPLKIVYISKLCNVTKRRVLATIIVAKFQEFSGLILSMIVATALLVWHTDYFTRRNEGLLIVVMFVLAALCAIILYAFAGRLQLLVTVIDLLARFRALSHQMARLRTLAVELEALIHTAVANRLRIFSLAQAITCLSAVSVFIRPWIFFRALPSLVIGFDQLCVFFVLTTLVNALTLIPGALGVFEASMAGYADASGLGDDKGAAFAIVNRIADLTLVVIGCWLIAHYGLSKIARGLEEEKDTAAEGG